MSYCFSQEYNERPEIPSDLHPESFYAFSPSVCVCVCVGAPLDADHPSVQLLPLVLWGPHCWSLTCPPMLPLFACAALPACLAPLTMFCYLQTANGPLCAAAPWGLPSTQPAVLFQVRPPAPCRDLHRGASQLYFAVVAECGI